MIDMDDYDLRDDDGSEEQNNTELMDWTDPYWADYVTRVRDLK
jgi:hypothetical protein